MNALSGGVFAKEITADDEYGALRQLVDDIGRRSFDARVGQRRVPEQFDTDLWQTLENTGLTRLVGDEDSDAGPSELAVVLAGIAGYAGAVPLAETDAMARWLGHRVGSALPEGPLTVAVANASEFGGRVVGTATDVPWTRASAAVVLLARTPRNTLVGAVHIAAADVTDGHNAAGEPRDEIAFDVPAHTLVQVDPALGVQLQMRGAWCRSVQIIGALDAAAAMTVKHTSERQQFGRSLSKFQSVQHAMATMAGEIERARASTSLAVAAAADHGFDSPQATFAITAARVAVGRAVSPVTTIAHQLHGAIGVTSEHPLWSTTMRSQCWANDFGTTAEYARRLGRMALGAADPWDLTIGNLELEY